MMRTPENHVVALGHVKLEHQHSETANHGHQEVLVAGLAANHFNSIRDRWTCSVRVRVPPMVLRPAPNLRRAVELLHQDGPRELVGQGQQPERHEVGPRPLPGGPLRLQILPQLPRQAYIYIYIYTQREREREISEISIYFDI